MAPRNDAQRHASAFPRHDLPELCAVSVRIGIARPARPTRPSHPRLTCRDDRDTPSASRRETGEPYFWFPAFVKRDIFCPRAGQHFCKTAWRANQMAFVMRSDADVGRRVQSADAVAGTIFGLLWSAVEKIGVAPAGLRRGGHAAIDAMFFPSILSNDFGSGRSFH